MVCRIDVKTGHTELSGLVFKLDLKFHIRTYLHVSENTVESAE
jgi:hypothetical protein